jgi:hypothetical protein
MQFSCKKLLNTFLVKKFYRENFFWLSGKNPSSKGVLDFKSLEGRKLDDSITGHIDWHLILHTRWF